MMRRNDWTRLVPLLLLTALLWGAGCSSEEPAEPEATEETTEAADAAESSSRLADRPSMGRGPVEELEAPPIEGFKQLMPRGGIPALFDPVFVTAAAAEIPDDAWVMGIEVEGQAYAYDLNILNHHEVVNHEVGGTPIAAVW